MMKKLFALTLALLMTLSLAGCGGRIAPRVRDSLPEEEIEEQGTQTDAEEETAEEAEQKEQSEEKEDSPCTVHFRYFDLTVPEEWLGNFGTKEIDSGEEALGGIAFYEKIAYERVGCGHLFTVIIVSDPDYQGFANGGVFGEITIDGQLYYLCAIYPSDVQFEPDTQEVYHMMYESIGEVEKTISSDIYEITLYEEHIFS